MTMTIDEICKNYRESKDKPMQIKILADLNCTSVEEIGRILVNCGEKAVEPKKLGRPKKKEDNKRDETKPALAVPMPEIVEMLLGQELDRLDAQIKEFEAQIKLLSDRYREIADFMKLYHIN